MTHEGRLRQYLKSWGRYEDVELYAILGSEISPGQARPQLYS